MPQPIRLLAVCLLLGGCATLPASAPSRAAGDVCIDLFQRYDLTKATMSTPVGAADRMPIPPALEAPVRALRSAGCLTLSADLAGLGDVSGTPVADGGTPIATVGLHVGVVTNMQDDAAAQAFFEARGVPTRSVGAPGLGRRIYIGPFATDGALEAARGLALEAGFASPYPARF